jgi:hypothetical protein
MTPSNIAFLVREVRAIQNPEYHGTEVMEARQFLSARVFLSTVIYQWTVYLELLACQGLYQVTRTDIFIQMGNGV